MGRSFAVYVCYRARTPDIQGLDEAARLPGKVSHAGTGLVGSGRTVTTGDGAAVSRAHRASSGAERIGLAARRR